MPDSPDSLSAAVRALANGDLGEVADKFSRAGLDVRLPAPGVLRLGMPVPLPGRARLLLSVGVHGDETAPIELLAQWLDELARAPHALALELMFVVGNPAAIARGARYIDADLNRMFCDERGTLQEASEAARADEIMRAAAAFFTAVDGEKWHLDLHTAIRPSHFPMFAVVPASGADSRQASLLGWLGNAGMGAAILNSAPAATFSAWTAQSLGAVSATLELGQIRALGNNDLRQFASVRDAIAAFIRDGKPSAGQRMPEVFKLAQEVIKHSDHFCMAFDRSTWNFTPMQPGTLIADDGDIVYRVGTATEYVVFPNPDVRPGLRAGLMVVRVPESR